MNSIVQSLLMLSLAALALPVCVLFFQVLFAVRAKASPRDSTGVRPSVDILIPAHNEEAVICRTLAHLTPQLLEGDRLLVVADNCSDQTATIARCHGAQVYERADTERRGKGYALDCGVRWLEYDQRDVLVIIDADCIAEPGTIEALAVCTQRSGRPVQSLNLMTSATPDRRSSRIAEFAWVVKNHVRPLGFGCFDLPCQLQGTGMAFPWWLIATASLANGHLVEDMKLGLDLAEQGYPALFCPQAKITSTFPQSAAAIATQRLRWEHGHIGMILGTLPRICLTAARNRDAPLMALALDMMVPPLALLSLLVAGVAVSSAFYANATGIWLPAAGAAMLSAMYFTAIALAWWKFGRRIVSFLDLCHTLGYIVWKIPLYAKYFYQKQVRWIRTERG
ncbi:glycosyltransferase family 2 protein [Pseudoduganella namucuonensis]|nr:glycosyltransferase family 2 protein [Pseudoduganella namucuonensis]